MARRRTEELTGMAPVGADDRIPYDQTDPMEEVASPGAGDPSLYQDASAAADASAVAPTVGGLAGLAQPQAPQGLAALGGDNSDAMPDTALAGLDQGQGLPEGIQSPEDQQVAQMSQALDDPNLSPDQKAMIQQELDLAARRKMAGLGGLGG